jgi:hypothetical protein
MKTAQLVTERGATGSSDPRGPSEAMSALAARVRGEYTEMPGLRLTVRQAARLFAIPVDVAAAVLHELQRASVLALSSDGAYSLIAVPSRWDSESGWQQRSRRSDASLDRLACLLRHWTSADEAMVRFERELAEALARVRRVHHALGEALRKEQVSREIDSLDH